MSVYTLKTIYKKSVVSTETWRKDGKIITIEEGYRWGSFTLTTDDDEAPEVDVVNSDGVNPYMLSGEGNIEDSEMDELDDCCWFEADLDELDPEEQERLEAAFEEESHLDVLESEGWDCEDTELVFQGPLLILDENGEEVARGE